MQMWTFGLPKRQKQCLSFYLQDYENKFDIMIGERILRVSNCHISLQKNLKAQNLKRRLEMFLESCVRQGVYMNQQNIRRITPPTKKKNQVKYSTYLYLFSRLQTEMKIETISFLIPQPNREIAEKLSIAKKNTS